MIVNNSAGNSPLRGEITITLSARACPALTYCSFIALTLCYFMSLYSFASPRLKMSPKLGLFSQLSPFFAILAIKCSKLLDLWSLFCYT